MSGVGIKVDFVKLQPASPSNVPNGALFLDTSNASVASVKGTNGVVATLGTTGSNIFIKQMQAGGAFLTGQPLAKLANGKVIAGDADGAQAQQIVGYALADAAQDGDLVNVLCIGANLAGAILNMNFSVGDTIYLSKTGGYTNDLSDFTDYNETIMKVGIADCAAGLANPNAVDLISFAEVITRPALP